MGILSDLMKSDIYLLFEVIKEKSQMLDLPMNESQKVIGFGNFHGFYMFYIKFSNEKNEWLFCVRKEYVKDLEDNSYKIILKSENEREILDRIDDIYNKYLEFKKICDKEKTENNNESKLENTYERNFTYYMYVKNLDNNLEKVREKILKDGDYAIPSRFLPKRARTILLSRKILTFKDLSNYTGHDIYNWAGCGTKTMRDLISIMGKYTTGSIGTELIGIDSTEYTYVYDDSLIKRIENVVLDNSFNNISKDDVIDDWYYHGKELINIIDEVFSLINVSYDKLEIFKEYIYNDDNTTLQVVGDKHQLTRERIRQIVYKVKMRCFHAYKSKSMNLYHTKVKNIFDKINDDQIIDFISYGLLIDNSERKIKFILSIILQSEAVAENIVRIARENMKISDESLDKFNLLEMAHFPGERYSNVNLNEIEKCPELNTFEYLKNMKNKLIKLKQVEEIVERPNICFYRGANGERQPHFLIKLKTGEIILVIAYPTISFAKHYNRDLFNSLHLYCKSHNFGYIIMNDRFKTIFDIKNIVLDVDLVEEMNDILNRKKFINWADIKKIRQKYKLTEEMLVGYVLKNNLFLNLKPFIIGRR